MVKMQSSAYTQGRVLGPTGSGPVKKIHSPGWCLHLLRLQWHSHPPVTPCVPAADCKQGGLLAICIYCIPYIYISIFYKDIEIYTSRSLLQCLSFQYYEMFTSYKYWTNSIEKVFFLLLYALGLHFK